MDALSLLTSFAELSLANPLIQAAAVGALRSVAGWIQHSIEDGEFSMIDLRELISTIMRMIPQTVGLGALGMPFYGALFSDVFVTKLSKIADKK